MPANAPRSIRRRAAAGTLSVLAAGAVVATPAASAATASTGNGKHVLLISVDGMHQSDLTAYITANPRSTLASLASGGTQYTHAATTQPSDSFPGMLAMVTGATSKSTGVYYDDSYDRSMYAPGSNCAGTPGTEAQLAENIDKGTANGSRPILGGTIDPALLPLQLTSAGCTAVMPNDFSATNSIFSVIKQSNPALRTAWSDKHPAYQILNGNGTPNAIDDLFTPEINADIIPASLTDTRGNTVNFPLNGSGAVITNSEADTQSYDQIKVDGVLNEIDGLTSGGAATAPAGVVPSILGMNFQAVSVGQKLVDPVKSCVRSKNGPGCDPNYVPGGYQPGTLAFTPQLSSALDYVNGALGQMVKEINAKGMNNSVEIILSAKHGQSPIDPALHQLVGDPITPVVTNAGGTVAQLTTDDVALLWLADQSKIAVVAQALRDHASTDYASKVLEGGTTGPADPANSLYGQFGYPAAGTLQGNRQPDIIVLPTNGVIYSGSKAKVAEHGGFNPTDTSVPLVVDATTPAVATGAVRSAAVAAGSPGTIATPVTTTQIAPTILQTLGINYLSLTGVQMEGTQPLPGDTPPMALPETPLGIALPAVAALITGAVIVRRRRHQQPAA